MTTNVKINIGDVWEDVNNIKINISDVWKDIIGIKINIEDSWETVFTTGSGTFNNPYDSLASLNAGIAELSNPVAFDTILYVKDGTYTDYWGINFTANSSSTGTTVTVRPQTLGGVVFTSAGSTFKLSGKYLIFQGFDIQNSSGSVGNGNLLVFEGCQNCRVTDCQFKDVHNAQCQIGVTGVDNNLNPVRPSTNNRIDHCNFDSITAGYTIEIKNQRSLRGSSTDWNDLANYGTQIDHNYFHDQSSGINLLKTANGSYQGFYFTSGDNANVISADTVISGVSSGATGKIYRGELTSGSWASGTAVGWLEIVVNDHDCHGIFIDGETVQITSPPTDADACTVNGDYWGGIMEANYDSDTIIEYNLIENIDTNRSEQIAEDKSGGTKFRFNTVINCGGSYAMRAGNNKIIEGNFFSCTGVCDAGSYLHGIRISGHNHIIRNNYLQGKSVGIYVYYGHDETGGCPTAYNVQILNNTIIQTGSPIYSAINFYDQDYGDAPHEITIQNNLVEVPGGWTANAFEYCDGANITWVSNRGHVDSGYLKDSNITSGVDDSGSFELTNQKSGLPFNWYYPTTYVSGTYNADVTKDIQGQNRPDSPTVPNIGCDEDDNSVNYDVTVEVGCTWDGINKTIQNQYLYP